ncbi:MAG TPA: hypothetical protein VFG89_08530 [Coriobacteriia bacterium]|nr:hypothetical protein [Coriobacteriia bacterium]
MIEKTVAEKARVKPGVAVATINAVQPVVDCLGLPGDAVFVAPDAADIVMLFVNTQAELDAELPKAVAALKPGAAVWVFFKKGAKAAGYDMNRDSVWYAAEPLGLRPLGIVGIDDTWSAFRLRPGA